MYTPKHPEVIALEDSLAQLRSQRREELQKLGITEMPERGGLVANPVYEQIRLQRNQVDVELAAMREQVAERNARVNDMRSKMATMPEVEAELSQLTRDYDVLRERYAAMLKQFENAKLSEQVGETDAGRLLDPRSSRGIVRAGGAEAAAVASRGAAGGSWRRRCGRLCSLPAEPRVRLAGRDAGRDRAARARGRECHVA